MVELAQFGEIPAPVILASATCVLHGTIVSEQPTTMTVKFETIAEALLFVAVAKGCGWDSGDIVHWGGMSKYGVMVQEVHNAEEVTSEEPAALEPWFSDYGKADAVQV